MHPPENPEATLVPYRSTALTSAGDEIRARAMIAPFVGDEEQLLWVGRPEQGLALDSGFKVGAVILTLLTAIPMALTMWAGHVVGALAWLLLPALFALYRLAVEPAIRAETAYAITTERVISVSGSRMEALAIAEIPQMTVTAEGDGSGAISFGKAGADGSFSLSFVRVTNVRALQRLVADRRTHAKYGVRE